MEALRSCPRVLVAGVVILVVVWSGIAFVAVQWKQRDTQALETVTRAKLRVLEQTLRVVMLGVVRDVRSYATAPSTVDFLEAPDSTLREEIEAFYRGVSRFHPTYHQIRMFDLQGRERMRVNQSGKVVEVADLQDKRHRYYFQEALELGPGRVFVSRVDLNIEEEKIEVPHVPMIRILTPVVSEDRIVGYFGINFLADFVRNEVDALAGEGMSGISVLNADGYRIASPERDRDWAFMFEERESWTWAEKHPRVWSLMADSPRGRVSNQGLVMWEKLVLATRDPPHIPIRFQEPYWILVREASPAFLRGRYGLVVPMVAGAFVLAGLLVVLTMITFAFRMKSLREAQAASNFMHSMVNGVPVAILLTDPRGRVVVANDHAVSLTGYAMEELRAGFSPTRLFRNRELEKAGLRVEDPTPGRCLFLRMCDRASNAEAEWTLVTKSGGEVPVFVSVRPLSIQGKRMVVAALTDLSRQHQLERELEKAEGEKDKAVREISELKRIIPICSYCKKIRDEEGAWRQLEAVIAEQFDTGFSHGICRDCMENLFPGASKSE